MSVIVIVPFPAVNSPIRASIKTPPKVWLIQIIEVVPELFQNSAVPEDGSDAGSEGTDSIADG